MKSAVHAFCRALWKGDARTAANLIRKVDPNGKDRWGHTPLLAAAAMGDLASVKLLVERGANVDQGRVHLTPITLAARCGAAAVVAFLRERRALVSPVTWVYLGDRARIARGLGADRAMARLRDEEGTPLLCHAARALAPSIVALLLDRGAPVDERTVDGESALHAVADTRRAPPQAADVATLLLDRGADPNARNWYEVTPLHQAVRARNLAVTEVLLARGADPNARDKRGSTPLRRAISRTGASGTAGTDHLMVPLARLLLSHGADPAARDARGAQARASAKDRELRELLRGAAPRSQGPGKSATRQARGRRRSR